jgi:hypothetical protein
MKKKIVFFVLGISFDSSFVEKSIPFHLWLYPPLLIFGVSLCEGLEVVLLYLKQERV